MSITAIALRRPRGRPPGSRDRAGAARRVPIDHRVRNMAAWRAVSVAFGWRMRSLMDERDIAAAELAAAIGCSATAVHGWTSGRHFPSIPTLLCIAAALRCSLVDLMPEEAHHTAEPVRSAA